MDATHPALTSATRSSDWYELGWSDGYRGRYPYVWLRDNCRCSACYYPSARQRMVRLSGLDVDLEPEKEEIVGHGEEFKVHWTNHVSNFPSKWLHRNRFDKTKFDSVRALVPKAWGSEMVDKLPKFDFKAVMEDSSTLRQWLTSLVVSGIAVITGAPLEAGTVERIGQRVGHLRTTMYGGTFQVIAAPESNNVAYTNQSLDLHSDLASCEVPPSVQLLHCIKQCEMIGGESCFSDGMKVVQDLKENDPEAYDKLTKVKVDVRSSGVDFIQFHYQSSRPIIALDEEGNFKDINQNYALRAPYMNIPVEQVKRFYRSLASFERTLNSKENRIDFKMKEGDIVIFSNNRVLHGRASFEIPATVLDGKKIRHLEGGYFDWDVIRSRLRLLYEELEDPYVL